MITLKDVIELYKIGLNLDYFSVDDVINWADYMIEIEAEPTYEIIDISMSKNANTKQMIEKLNSIECYRESDLASKILLGLMYIDFDNGKESIDYLKSLARSLYKLSLHISDESVGDDIKYKVLTAEDYLESVLYYDYDGSLTLENFVDEMEELLKPFHVYALELEDSKFKVEKTNPDLEIISYWYSFEDGKSIGTKGSENGTIIKDEEYSDGARITLEKCKTPTYSITYGIYGLMCDTKHYGDMEASEKNFELIKYKIVKLIDKYPIEGDDLYDEIIQKEYESFHNIKMIPFAYTNGGDYWCFDLTQKDYIPIICCYHDGGEGEYYAKTLEAALFRQILDFTCNEFTNSEIISEYSIATSKKIILNWIRILKDYFPNQWIYELNNILNKKDYVDSSPGYVEMICENKYDELVKKYIEFDLLDKKNIWTEDVTKFYK